MHNTFCKIIRLCRTRLTSLARGGNVSLGIAEDIVEKSFVKHINIKKRSSHRLLKESRWRKSKMRYGGFEIQKKMFRNQDGRIFPQPDFSRTLANDLLEIAS